MFNNCECGLLLLFCDFELLPLLDTGTRGHPGMEVLPHHREGTIRYGTQMGTLYCSQGMAKAEKRKQMRTQSLKGRHMPALL